MTTIITGVPGRGRMFLIVVLFLATGASSLIYQVVWQRYLLNVFGATIYSVSAVLSAFMGGLALGSWLFGRRSERMQSPLLVYGVLEILIGISALAVPLLLRILDPIFTWSYQHFGSAFLLYSIIRFIFVFLILLIPTTLMGATLPILSRYLTGSGGQAGVRVGLLYAVNTTGAVLGAFLSGFYFLRWWGVSTTVALAAGINVIAGLLAIGLSRVSSSAIERPEVQQEARPIDPAAKWVLLAYAVSGFVALGLEVTWSRSLVFTFDSLKNTTYAFTAMLTTFLVGIATGSAAMAPFANRLRQPFRFFALLQILIGLVSIFSFFVLYYAAYNLGGTWLMEFDKRPGQIRWNVAVALVFLRTAAVLLLPTFCMGLAFPVAVRAVTEGSYSVGRDVGRLYALNTVGAILGAAITGFLLLPVMGVGSTILLLGALQMVIGVALVFQDTTANNTRRYVWAGLTALALFIAFVRMPRPAIFQPLTPVETMVHYEEGPLATVSVVENSLRYRTIYVDNVGVAGTDPMLLTDQKSLAHVPMLLLKDPKSALTVGFGSGGASYSYTVYPELDRIDCVEITRTVPKAAPFLKDSNRGVIDRLPLEVYSGIDWSPKGDGQLEGRKVWKLWPEGPDGWIKNDERFNLVLDDARSYLRFTDRQYDIIATDCTDLRYKSNANLYDLQYFQLCRDRITDDGMVVVWMPLAGLSDDAMKVALRTFFEVFPEMEVFFMNNQPTHYVLLIGTKQTLKVDAAQVKKKVARPEIIKDLGEIHMANAAKLLSCFITGRARLGEYLQTKKPILNTEDNPYLEFESPRYGYSDEPLLDNLDELFRFREDPARLVADAEGNAEFLTELKRYADAVPDIISGHREYRELKVVEAARKYMAALAKNPDDSSVKDLLNFDELKRKVSGQSNQHWAQWTLGEVLAMQDRDSEAVTELNAFLAMPIVQSGTADSQVMEFRKSAFDRLASIYEKLGKPEKAAQYRQRR